MGRKIDLTNKRSGKLVAKKMVGQCEKSKGMIWECECDCGKTIEILAGTFFYRKSCGCLNRRTYESKTTDPLIYEKSCIKLKPGRTYEEYIIKRNELVPYFEICRLLNISFSQAREIYDRVWNLELEEIGIIEKPKLKAINRKSSKPIELDIELTNDDCITYSHAIIIKASEDWRELCNGGNETYNCNFNELEEFFRDDCDTFLAGKSVLAKEILEKLQKEREESI